MFLLLHAKRERECVCVLPFSIEQESSYTVVCRIDPLHCIRWAAKRTSAIKIKSHPRALYEKVPKFRLQ